MKDTVSAPPEKARAPRNSSPKRADSDPSPRGKSFKSSPLLAQVLAEAGFQGSIALYDGETRQLLCSTEGACDVPLRPASTFKIPHTLIGLELGELESTEHVFKWDGRTYSMPAWNQDHTLRSALTVSCVPCFQQLARKIGEERMTRALSNLGYGNATLGGPIDAFWLEAGGLRITAREQLEFLYGLQTRALPFRVDAMEATIDVMPKTVFHAESEAVLRGKTGMILDPDVGWYVGWLEWRKGTTFFATALFGENDRAKLLEARRALTILALRRYTKESLIE
jgi:beta-lactamase class D